MAQNNNHGRVSFSLRRASARLSEWVLTPTSRAEARRRLKPTLLGIIFIAAASAGVLDRIAVTVGNDAITEGEVLEEIRITSFLNGDSLDFSPTARRAAAERLVDQYLIRRELAGGGYGTPDPAQAGKVVDDLIQTRFHGRAEYEQKLKQYGISQDDLKAHLLFQLQAIEFTDLRFAPPPPKNEADRTATPVSDNQQSAKPVVSDKVDQQLDAWLKQVRSQTRVEFKKGAFE
jgi:hypothetical protein